MGKGESWGREEEGSGNGGAGRRNLTERWCARRSAAESIPFAGRHGALGLFRENYIDAMHNTRTAIPDPESGFNWIFIYGIW